MIRKERIVALTPGRNPKGNVVYWMSREQRVSDNPGLLYARQLAGQMHVNLLVVFILSDGFLGAAWRHYDFMLKGLQETARKLHQKNIPFHLLKGDPPGVLSDFLKVHGAGTVITDFDPLRIKQEWVSQAILHAESCFIEVDGHNVVPARFVSGKLEFGAYTLRPKINRLLPDFLHDFPELQPQDHGPECPPVFDPDAVILSLDPDRSVPPVKNFLPGEDAAMEALENFILIRLSRYDTERNDPNLEGTSGLSPYLHFGQISPQRVAAEVIKRDHGSDASKAFLEELIVRRELSDNFCLHQPDYDKETGFHPWARKTHMEHARDEREYLYDTDGFEHARTHDPLWNAAQLEMVVTGKMHGYMRMYWAKKILEWTPDVATAMKTAIYLNDKYSLDGRDPNGYTGIAWSLGGVHDRAWTERPVFGKIRYMNYNGARRKFDVDGYIRKVKNKMNE